MRNLTENELINLGGGDKFLYDLAYFCALVYQGSIEASRDKTYGTYTTITSHKMAGL
jgi:hypothetical protein